MDEITLQDLKKTIMSTTWTIQKLFDSHNLISKPKFQRKMRWGIKPVANKKQATFREFMDFLMKYKNSQIPIALGQYIESGCIRYNVSDGNNRIHAILFFLKEPYKLYDDFYNDIINYINKNIDDNDEKKQLIKKIRELNYDTIYNNSFDEACITDDTTLNPWFDKLPTGITRGLSHQWKELKNRFCFGEAKFDITTKIKIVVNIFENFTYEELSENYKEVHSKQQTMDEFDILAASLGSMNITIEDTVLKEELKNVIVDYYKNRAREDEILGQYTVADDFQWSAFDFLLAFQEHCCDKYDVFKHINFEKGMKQIPFIFRLFNITICKNEGLKKIYFTTENINIFIQKCENAFEHLQCITQDMYPNLNEKCEVKVFKDVSDKCGKIWGGVQILILLSILSSEKYKHTRPETQHLKCLMFYHSFIKQIRVGKDDLKGKEDKKQYQLKDWLEPSRAEIRGDTTRFCDSIHNDPSGYLEKVPKSKDLKKVLNYIILRETKKNIINPCDARNGKKRKQVSWTNYILMTDYWSRKMPNHINQSVKNDGVIMHNDHLIPFSTKTSFPISLDRLGNFSPLMAKTNCSRGNGHIKCYWDNMEIKKIIDNLEIFPNNGIYDSMVKYIKRGSNDCPHLKNSFEYNNFCDTNEKKYIDSFIEGLKN